jgi:short-subunit dehydrogenase
MAKRTIAGSRGIVTGASSGIGRAIAAELFKNGARVLVVARRQDRLRDLASKLCATGNPGRIEVHSGDVREASVRQAAIAKVQDRFGGVDFLVNAAGISSVARFAESAPDRLREIMEVNFFAPIEMIRAAIPVLRQGNQPIIVNIGSILGHRGIPWHSDYCASKFALRGFSESIRPELAKLGIDLLIVSPGTTKTNLYENDADRSKLPWPQLNGVSPEYVARKTVRAMVRGRREIIPNPKGRLLVCLSRWCPWLLDRLMARYG